MCTVDPIRPFFVDTLQIRVTRYRLHDIVHHTMASMTNGHTVSLSMRGWIAVLLMVVILYTPRTDHDLDHIYLINPTHMTP